MADTLQKLLQRATLSFVKAGGTITDPRTGRSFEATRKDTNFRIFLNYRPVAYDFSPSTIISQGITGQTRRSLAAFNIDESEISSLAIEASNFLLREFKKFEGNKDTTIIAKDYIVVINSLNEADNFGILQKRLTTIKNRAIQQVKAAINSARTDAKLTTILSKKENKVATFTAVVVAGFKLGKYVRAKRSEVDIARLSTSQLTDRTAGLDIGHTTGAILSAAYDAVRVSRKLGLDVSQLKPIVEEIENIDAELRINNQVKTTVTQQTSIKTNIVVTVTEQSSKNRSEGSRAQKPFQKFLDTLTTLLAEKYADELEKNDIPFIRSSPSVIDTYVSFYENLFTEKSYTANVNSKAKINVKVFDKVQTQLYNSKPNKTLTIKSGERDGLDLERILTRVNIKLHDYLKRNMGKGRAPKRLNYQTGRFANSAEVKALTPTRGNAIEATITYLRNPYDVFLPGGKLHNELRDPQKLIGKSVRQILADELQQRLNVRTRLV